MGRARDFCGLQNDKGYQSQYPSDNSFLEKHKYNVLIEGIVQQGIQSTVLAGVL